MSVSTQGISYGIPCVAFFCGKGYTLYREYSLKGKGASALIDLMNVAAYRENNRIEAKKALGGLPRSIWETYSAFANALGGVILLGVEEHKDTSLSPVDLPDPEGMVRQFWTLLKDGKTVSVNILTEDSVQIAEVDGKHIISIEVPRARRTLRPVYIGGDPMTGTYRRNGEGDYRCKREEVLEMQRDAARQTRDMRPLPMMDMAALEPGSVVEYLRQAGQCGRPAEDVLCSLGAAVREDGTVCPTAAGLLMFGREAVIRKEFPLYSVAYQCTGEALEGGETALIFLSGCNVFDFYSQVIERISAIFDAEILPAVQEALVNCLLNADYASGGVEIRHDAEKITFTNAGQFRVDVTEAIGGGVSDPRNLAMARLFAAVGVGRGGGSGLASMMRLWQQRGWEQPRIRESFAPAKVTVRLSFAPAASAPNENGKVPYALQKAAVLAYITEHIRVDAAEVRERLQGDELAAQRCLQELLQEGTLALDNAGYYRLKR